MAILGAFDRFNYGDLLFPIITKNEMATHGPEMESGVYALIESDLSRYGALRTRSVRSLYRDDLLRPDDIVLFAGGGTIGVDWHHMHSNLLGQFGNKGLYYLKRLIGENASNTLSRWRFGSRMPFPWVAAAEDFPVPVQVAYNAVGGSEFANLAPTVQALTLNLLSKATFLSVRDSETKRLFASLEDRLPVELCPDSAILMSEQFPVTVLEKLASNTLLEMTNTNPYVCFQANLSYSRKYGDRIASMLESLYERHGLSALLLPIGRYVGLDDHAALSSILAKIRTPAKIVSDEASIWEIMLAIAKARLFLGTSLHGNITSQSFAVPHLGLSDRPCKLDYYLNTWDLPEQMQCVQLDGVAENVEPVLGVHESVRQEKRAELINLSHENFTKLSVACGING